MKVKVMHKFTDKYTGELYNQGDVLTITEERYAEIMRVGGLVFPIAQDDALSVSDEQANTLSGNEEETLSDDSTRSDDGFELMSVRELKEYADRTYKLTFKGNMKKAEIIEELRRLERNGK